MNDDRSRADRALARETDGAREGWLDRLLDLFQLRSRDTIRADLEDALAERDAEAFTPQERAMLRNVLGFHRVRVEDVMVPRADIVAVPSDTSLGDLLGIFRTAGHSRLPVYGETLDDPKGMVHIRDFLDHIAARSEAGRSRRRKTGEGKATNLGDVDLSITLASTRILRPVLYVPRSMPAVDLLVRMQTTRTHMALVIDEYGGTDGLVSIEDLVESVVGDIEDEHDDAAVEMIRREEGGSILADARASLDDVSEALGLDLAQEETAEEIDTLAGFIVTLAGRVPSRGELIAGPDELEFEVLDADPRRLKRVRIHRRPKGLRDKGAVPRKPAADGPAGPGPESQDGARPPDRPAPPGTAAESQPAEVPAAEPRPSPPPSASAA
jgi:CBS domain containing-hemolysin-like protein